MTVAAIVLVPDTAVALADADGEPAIRRVVHAAWSGGALPIVIVTDDPDPRLAGIVADLGAALSRPTKAEPRGVAWYVNGRRAADRSVTGTTAGLLWPVRCTWVDPETVTSLVEAHGATPDHIVRPAWLGKEGFPILVPAAFDEQLLGRNGLHGYQAVEALIAEGAPHRALDLGDPGIVFDLATPRAELPGYQGPPEPAGGPPPDWNAALAAATDAQRSDEPGR
jgi:CTP:molybdopterin cytidylyltransferase MocA